MLASQLPEANADLSALVEELARAGDGADGFPRPGGQGPWLYTRDDVGNDQSRWRWLAIERIHRVQWWLEQFWFIRLERVDE